MSKRKHGILGLLLWVAIFVALLATFAACTLEGDIKAVREAGSFDNPFLGRWYYTSGGSSDMVIIFDENSYEVTNYASSTSYIFDRGTYTYSGKKALLSPSFFSFQPTAEIVGDNLVVTYPYSSGSAVWTFSR